MKYTAEYICRICWFQDKDPFYLETGWPSYQICICCNWESWYDDCTQIAIKNHRKKWIEWWCKWHYEEEQKPKDWNPLEQMKKIPKEYL